MGTKNRRIGVRSITAFWLLGLCNNYGFTVMLSAAYDILSHKDELSNITNKTEEEGRRCNEMSTGIILLADIIPSLFIKVVISFLPLWMNLYMFLIVITAAVGFILVGLSYSFTLTIIGVVITSLSAGLGECCLLAYTMLYKQKSIISAWSSGTGAAGFFGSISYTLLLAVGLSSSVTMYSLVSVPIVMAISYWIMLDSPSIDTVTTESLEKNLSPLDTPANSSKITFVQKLKKIPITLKYVIPLSFSFYFQYVINQGLFELVVIENASMNIHTQYRWYQVCYQIGVFVSRSSINFIKISNLWLLATLQGIVFVYFVVEAIFQFTANIYALFLIIVVEGLIGGLIYVNTFYKIQIKENANDREFITEFTSACSCTGITLAGFSSPVFHNQICALSRPSIDNILKKIF